MYLTCAKNAQCPSWIRQSTSLDNRHHIEIDNILQGSMASCSIPLLESGLLEHITAVSIVALVLPACHFINRKQNSSKKIPLQVHIRGHI